MASLQVEGPDTGWIAEVGFDEGGELCVLAAREGWERTADELLRRLLEEPAPSGRVPGASVQPDDEDTLYDLASSLMRRKPEYNGQRLTGYVSGGSRYVETGEVEDAEGI